MHRKSIIFIIIALMMVLSLGAGIGTYYYVQTMNKQAALVNAPEITAPPEFIEVNQILQTPSEEKQPEVGLISLISEFIANKSETSGFPDWKAGTGDNIPIKWIVENAELNQSNGLYTKSGTSSKFKLLIENRLTVSWSITLTGTKDYVKKVELWRPTAISFQLINMEKVFKDSNVSYKTIKSNGGSTVNGRRLYEINIPGKKTAWLDHEWNSGASGASARIFIYLDKVEADNVKFPAEMAHNNYVVPTPAALSKPTTIESGLLLGIKNNSMSTEGRYRTLWIAPKDGYIKLYQGSNFIIVPYGDLFWKIDFTRFLRDDSQKFGYAPNSYNPNYGADIRYFNPHPAAEAVRAKYMPETYIIPQNYIYEGRFDDLLFVGNKYVCMEQNTVLRDKGNTVNNGYTNMFQIADVGNNDKRLPLEELFGKSVTPTLEKYKIKDDSSLDMLKRQAIANSGEGNDIVFTRENGRFTAKLKTKYLDQKKNLITSGIIDLPDLPDEITTHNKLCIDWKVLQQNFPDIRDAVTSPNNDMLVVLTSNYLKIYQIKDASIGQEVFSYQLSKDSNIIMAQWATKNYVPAWFNEMVKYLK